MIIVRLVILVFLDEDNLGRFMLFVLLLLGLFFVAMIVVAMIVVAMIVVAMIVVSLFMEEWIDVMGLL